MINEGRPTITEILERFRANTKLKNPRQRQIEQRVEDRTTIMSDHIEMIEEGDDEVTLNDTDVLLLTILLSKTSFSSLRNKMYKLAKRLNLPTQ
jgi:transcriptional regulatory protein LevR